MMVVYILWTAVNIKAKYTYNDIKRQLKYYFIVFPL